MLKISETRMLAGRTVLMLEGALAGPWVDELRRLADECLATGPMLVLNTAGVVHVDGRGALELCALVERGADIEQPTRFVAQLLAQHRLTKADEP